MKENLLCAKEWERLDAQESYTVLVVCGEQMRFYFVSESCEAEILEYEICIEIVTIFRPLRHFSVFCYPQAKDHRKLRPTHVMKFIRMHLF